MGHHLNYAYFQLLALETFFHLFQKGNVLILRLNGHSHARRGRGHTEIIRRQCLQNGEVECGERFKVSIYDFKLQGRMMLVSGRVSPCPLYLYLSTISS